MCWVAEILGAEIFDMAAFPDGSSVLVGHHGEPITLDPGGPNETVLEPGELENTAYFLARFDADGALVWARRMLTSPAAVWAAHLAVTADSGFLAAGTFLEHLVLGSGEPDETVLENPSTGAAIFVGRYDAEGVLTWAVGIGSAGCELDQNPLPGLAVLDDGTVAVLGDIKSGELVLGQGEPHETVIEPGANDQLFIAALGDDGELAWAIGPGGYDVGEIRSRPAAATGGGTLATTGRYAGPVSVGQGLPGETWIDDPGDEVSCSYVAAFDPLVQVEWVGVIHTLGLATGVWALTGLADGSVALSGKLAGVAEIYGAGSSTTLLATPGDIGGVDELFAALLSPTGELVWARATSSPAGRFDLQTTDASGTSSGGIAITGVVRGRATFDPENPAASTVVGDEDDPEAVAQFVVIYDDQGQVELAAPAMNGSFYSFSGGQSIAGLGDGTALITGSFSDSGGAEFQLEDGTWHTGTALGERAAFLAKLCP